MTPQEKLEQYSKEITEDLKLNEMVIQQKSFEIPQRKHYWVTKLILETQELNKLERKKKVLEKTALEKQEPLVQMSTASMKKCYCQYQAYAGNYSRDRRSKDAG